VSRSVFGPWATNLDAGERLVRTRSLLALSLVFARSQPAFVEALARASRGDQEALSQAFKLLDRVPALSRRRLLASYNATAQELRRAG
jgi:hypothetical protein